MLSSATIFDTIRNQGIGFFAGVPDSLLKDFCAFVTDHVPDDTHVITANEGNAIALAMGWYLGTGHMALVYMQNSGIGNAINPLTSLADPEVYGIPMLVMVGWRGEPKVKDEPQHLKQGRITPALLDALELPWFVLDADTENAEEVVADACAAACARSTPAVLLVRSGCFEPYKLQWDRKTSYAMNREQALQRIVGRLGPNALLVSTTGKTSRELYEFRVTQGQSHGSDFLTVGGMGHTASIAMGLARARPDRQVVCLDGDGSVLMHMGSLAIIGRSTVKNLLHIVINNGAHDSVGGQPTVGFEIDLPSIARSCGYRIVRTVEDAETLDQAIPKLLQVDGPIFIEVRTNKGARDNLGRPRSTPQQNKDAFMTYIGVNKT